MKTFLKIGPMLIIFLVLLLVAIVLDEKGYLDFKRYSADDFEIEVIKSDIDYDSDGVDDYTDILNGAYKFIDLNPKYKSKYYNGGYPTDGYYVCTDLIWYALKEAGYDFKSMIDKDIKENTIDYDIDTIDPNIDFRRVKNIKVFLDKYALKLTTDADDYEEFQPGDIIVYENHIAIVSDVRNKDKISYIIHHDGFHALLDDGLTRKTIVGHYRFQLNEDFTIGQDNANN
jgi:hypothetical protein